jgi:hypothetical protein
MKRYKFKSNDVVRVVIPRDVRNLYDASYKARHSQSGVVVAQSTSAPLPGRDIKYIVEFANGDVMTYLPQHLQKV